MNASETERPQIVVAADKGRIIRAILAAFTFVVSAILSAPYLFTSFFFSTLTNQLPLDPSRELFVDVRRNAPGEVAFSMHAGPTAAEKARTGPALSWPVEQLAGIPATHKLVRKSDSLREDQWAFGSPSTGAAFAGLTFVQGDADRFHRNGFLIEALHAVRVSGARRVTGPYYDFNTRFGRFNGRDILIEDGIRQRTCIGFVSAFDTPGALISGVFCDIAGKSADPGPVACMIDRIRFEPAQLQPGLAILGERSQSARSACASNSYHEPGRRNPVYDSRGRYRGLR